MQSLGINIGSSSIKLVLLNDGKPAWHKVIEHEGNFLGTLKQTLANSSVPEKTMALATGTEGRFLLNMNNVIESICIEAAVKNLGLDVDAVVSLGGEIFVVYTIDSDGKIITSFSGNKCASGTGEFFKQQLGRMDMKLGDIISVSENCRVHGMASRCSVFMKSDCTHKLNKGEATKDEIVLSLSDVMATKVVDFLRKARIKKGRVLLSGGVTKNRFIVKFIRDRLPNIEFIVPAEAPYLEAYGAAILAASSGSPLPAGEAMYKPYNLEFGTYPSLKQSEGRVHYIQSKRGKAKPGREYILGVDGGSTTTKVTLIDIETNEIVAAHYGRTHGDPVKALKECLIEVKKQLKEQIGDAGIKITLVSTTGSSREILGVFLETPAVYNEIIAHAVGTTFFKSDIDTIFEIGGQDAKYVYLKNKVPIDYAMNEACSAGTGSFLEESASGDLNITNVWEIGDIALQAENPLKFGEHCSAFINSDIRKAIQLGATRENITAGIITSIVSNYLNRVVGNRSIGGNIVLQGGVAKNRAVPLAFAMHLGKDVTVPPDPELLGCFGVGLLARQKFEDGLIGKGDFDIDAMLATEIVYEREFKCQACKNYCPIRVLNVNGHKYMFGGRCNKYANARKKKEIDESKIFNYIEKRDQLMFVDCSPARKDFRKKRDFVVGVPKAFSVYTMWPLYSWFFHSLGIETVMSENVCYEGVARTEGSYCFPAEIAHGAVQDIINMNLDYIFVPHFRDLESLEDDVHANFCPITQSLPYYVKKAFPEIPEEKFLTPIVSFKFGKEKALEAFIDMGKQLGVPEREVRAAFKTATEKQEEFWTRYKEMGIEALERARKADHAVIAVLGRPYNAFTRDANMGIPLKFTSRGFSVIPFDMLPYDDSQIFDNMYWYYGQQNMKAGVKLKEEDNIFLTYITNFSCAPDSFMLHYVKWIMGLKPFLVLELDSHSADAGIDTRVEAFLDIIEGYRSKMVEIKEERFDNGLRFVNDSKEGLYLVDGKTNNRIEIFNNSRVKMLLSNMGRLSAELLAATLRCAKVNAEAMPLPDTFTLQMARNHMSGKECIPSQLVLGSALKYFSSSKYRKDEIYLLFVPTTTGPCRTGQYFIFYENLFRDMRLENVVVVTLDSDNSYNELGPDFSKNAWWGLVVADYMKDIETSLRTCAVDPVTAIARYDELWQQLIDIAEKDITGIIPALKGIAAEISKIPLKKRMVDCPKVLVVGEIYVRRDDFAVDELVRLLSRKGVIAKISGITEWIYYCDYTRKHDLQKRFGLLPWYKKFFSSEFKGLVLWKLEEIYKHRVEKKVKKALKTTNLIPETPHDMEKIMKNADENFVTSELYSEISISSGVAYTAMTDDFSGIINISPFACLIGRVIEGLITPWSREKRYPVISIEIDGDILPPNIINKLDIFTLNVIRFRGGTDSSELVESHDREVKTFSRKIMKA
ncbi:MAG: acyl-CoA dehydratase activase [Spirochaetes bacterium]|jgi:predicted CoA-substrate-specific enzyme activase|nr:acyl-CoA dehydratase activase [Spirochaetota bacterium]